MTELLSEELLDQVHNLLRLFVKFLFLFDLRSRLKFIFRFQLLLPFEPDLDLKLTGELAVADVAADIKKLVSRLILLCVEPRLYLELTSELTIADVAPLGLGKRHRFNFLFDECLVRDRVNDQTGDREILWRFDKDLHLFQLLLDGLHGGVGLGLGFGLLHLLTPHLNLELAGDLTIADLAADIWELVCSHVAQHRLLECGQLEGSRHRFILRHSQGVRNLITLRLGQRHRLNLYLGWCSNCASDRR